jgi:transcription antitermination factor NusG
MSRLTKKWFVVYTKPRWEKKVNSLLIEEGIQSYCPLNKVRKKWSDRMKWVEEPLFNSYVFVRIDEEEHARVRAIDGVVNFVYWLGKPAVVRNKEIEVIQKFLNEYKEVVATPLDLHVNDKVRIDKGIFMDKEAKVMKVVNRKVQVVIESIGYSLVATIDRSSLAQGSRS